MYPGRTGQSGISFMYLSNKFLNLLNSPVKFLSTYGSKLKSPDLSTLIHFSLSVLILKTLPETLGNSIYLQNLSENFHLSPREGTIPIMDLNKYPLVTIYPSFLEKLPIVKFF